MFPDAYFVMNWFYCDAECIISEVLLMAAEGKANIFYRCNLFYIFVSIDERSPIGSQLNLASRSDVMLIYKCTQKFGGKKKQIFLRLPHSTPHISGTKRRIDKNASVNLQCPLKVGLHSWPLTQKLLRSVCVWPTLWRLLHRNHHSYDMSSL